jgi:Aromatic-ring-opening dioxygenase LigAB, LigA subunit
MTSNWRQMIPTVDAFWIDRVLFDVQHDPAAAARFAADKHSYLKDLPLTAESRRLLQINDIGGLYLAGANPYLLRAHCLHLRIPDPEYLSALRAVGDAPHG